jgi:hypothetical protein
MIELQVSLWNRGPSWYQEGGVEESQYLEDREIYSGRDSLRYLCFHLAYR